MSMWRTVRSPLACAALKRGIACSRSQPAKDVRTFADRQRQFLFLPKTIKRSLRWLSPRRSIQLWNGSLQRASSSPHSRAVGHLVPTKVLFLRLPRFDPACAWRDTSVGAAPLRFKAAAKPKNADSSV